MFKLDEEEQKKYTQWLNDHNKECVFADPMSQGAIGGRFTYCFTPTGLGVIKSVKCACGSKANLTDYDSW